MRNIRITSKDSTALQGYLNFLIDHREEFQMTVDDISNTFGCIERIFSFNRRLYHQFDATLLSVVEVTFASNFGCQIV